MIRRFSFLLLASFFFNTFSFSQVNWLGFDQLDSMIAVEKKPVLIDFYTSWCTFCKKMDQEVFTDETVIKLLNASFYAVKFDAESTQEIEFEGLKWQKAMGQNFHSLARFFSPPKKNFAPPLILFLDEDLEMKERVNAYQSRKKLLKKLQKHSGS